MPIKNTESKLVLTQCFFLGILAGGGGGREGGGIKSSLISFFKSKFTNQSDFRAIFHLRESKLF